MKINDDRHVGTPSGWNVQIVKKRLAWSAAILGVGLLSAAAQAGRVTFSYDDDGRLKGAAYGGDTRIDYACDANGNVLSRSATDGAVFVLMYAADTGGSISGVATQWVGRGASGTPVTPVTNRYYRFSQWSDAKTAAPRVDANVTSNLSVVARFAAILAAQGTPQWWLAAHGYSGDFDAAENSNTDGDPFTAAQEYAADTDPTNAASFFRIVSVENDPPFTVRFNPGSTGRVYALQFSGNLAGGAWTNVPGQGPRAGHGGTDSMTDTNAAPARFHRVNVTTP